MKKLKNINFKALLVDHGEKFGLGFMMLMVLLALGSTSWSRYEKTPEDITKKVDEASQRIKSPQNVWPQEKVAAFKVVDFTDKAQQIVTRMDLAKYEFSTPLAPPLYRKRELAREPEFRTIESLIAHSGLAILGVAAAPASTTVAADGAAEGSSSALETGVASTKQTTSTGGEFDVKVPGTGVGAAGAGAVGATPFAGSSHGGGAPKAAASPSSRGPSSSHGGGAAMPSGMDMYSEGGSGAGAGVTPRGVRFVAVRGVFPLKQQLDEYQRKLNATAADATAMFELLDFVLERQGAIAGSDPWAGKWETVNVESALEVLRECSDFEADPVRTDVTDAVITMSLPFRLLGYWGDYATHPNIKDFQLKPEEMAREQKMYDKLVEEYEKAQLQSKPKYERKGLASAQRDLRQMGNDMMASSEASEFMRGMTSYMNTEAGSGAGAGGPRMAPPDIKSRLTASGRLLLFRYFDFDVRPGMAYRYRVKLTLRNPNFERAVEEVVDPAIVQDPQRETGWSNISNAAVIPTSTNYFLKDVERDPMRDEKPRANKPVANIAMFEWDPKLGTMLSDTLKIITFGQFIGESKKKTWVLDVSVPSYEEKEVALLTEDILVDASGDLDVNPADHPDLGLKAEKGKRDARVGVVPEALVVTSLGELKQLDPISDKPKEEELKRRVDSERKNFLYLKDAPKETTSVLESGNAYEAMMGAEMPMPGRTKGSPKKNPKKVSGGAASRMGPMSDSGGSSSSAAGSARPKTSSKKGASSAP